MATLLARPAIRASARTLPVQTRAFSATPRSEATLRELEGRMKSVKNIGKVRPPPA